MMRTRNRKGQGLTEYGIILLLVLLIGTVVWFHFDVRGQLSGIYATVASDLKSIAGESGSGAEDYDTGQTKIVKGVLLHETSLFFGGKNICWYDKNGTKMYTIKDGQGNDLFTFRKNTNGIYYVGGGRYAALDNSYYTVFFRADDGNTYQMITSGGDTTNITKVSGTLPYVDTKGHVVSDDYAAAHQLSSRAVVNKPT